MTRPDLPSSPARDPSPRAPAPHPTPARAENATKAPCTVVAAREGLFRAGLAAIAGTDQTAPDLHAAIAALRADDDALLLLDLGLGGIPALRDLHAQFPGAPIIAIGPEGSRDAVLAALAAGACGFVAHDADAAELRRVIAAARNGGLAVPAALLPPALPALPAPSRLTGRQQDVLRLLAEGRSTKDIARTLDLAVSTIKVHLAALYRAVGARNRVEAICRAGAFARLPNPA